MAGEDKAKNDTSTGNAPGGRGGLGNTPDVGGALSNVPSLGGVGGNSPSNGDDKAKRDEGFGLDNKDVKGSLKVHIKLDLEADIRIIAKIKGDIAIGLL